MTEIDLSIVLTFFSVTLAAVFGFTALKRNSKADTKEDASVMATVIVKLENIGIGITEIKNEMTNVKNDIKESRERLIKVEESAKQAHKRLDEHLERGHDIIGKGAT
ncbi:MAG: hypothetical protein Q8865_03950 [Bacillota bacterium]|nr:hypothetical protein [Bacillota bacterium]